MRQGKERFSFKDYDPLSPQDAWRYNDHPYRWAFALIRPVKFTYIVAYILVFVTAIMAILPGILTGRFVQEVLVNKDHTNLVLYLSLLFLIPALRGILYFTMRNMLDHCSQHAMMRTRDSMYRHLQKLDQSFYNSTPTGTIMSYITSDLEMVRFFLNWSGFATIEQVFVFIIGGIYLFFLNWRLGLATLIVVPILFIVARKLEKQMSPMWQGIRRQLELLNSVVQENISGNRVTRAFVRKDFETKRFEKENVQFANHNKEAADIRAKYIPIIDGLANLMAIPVVLYGGFLTIQGQMEVGDLIVFYNLLFVLSNPTRMLGWLVDELKHFASSGQKIIELFMTKTNIISPEDIALSEEPAMMEDLLVSAAKASPSQERFQRRRDVENDKYLTRKWDGSFTLPETEMREKPRRGYRPEDKPYTLREYAWANTRKKAGTSIDNLVQNYAKQYPAKRTPLQGNVQFENVSYSYDKKGRSVLALKDINFTVEAGQTIGIIGVTGSGKSSLIELISRLDDPTFGRILLDGQDLRTFSLQEVRRNIGVVTQDVFLFSDTVEGNVAFADPIMPQEDAWFAAKVASAHDFIEKMEFGYETIIGERGVGLSGGQRQRISLARAVAADPAILILDDTTSAVDMNTDQEIRENLERELSHKTIFIVAQRISSIRNADMILVMDGGEIIERGTHNELVDLGGEYRKIYDVQMGDQASALEILELEGGLS